MKEGDKCGYYRLTGRRHVRAMNYQTEGEGKERGIRIGEGGADK